MQAGQPIGDADLISTAVREHQTGLVLDIFKVPQFGPDGAESVQVQDDKAASPEAANVAHLDPGTARRDVMNAARPVGTDGCNAGILRDIQSPELSPAIVLGAPKFNRFGLGPCLADGGLRFQRG